MSEQAEELANLMEAHEIRWSSLLRPDAECLCGEWHLAALLDEAVENAHRVHVAQAILEAGYVRRPQPIINSYDIIHIKHADGRCTISIDGQGHLPCHEHSDG